MAWLRTIVDLLRWLVLFVLSICLVILIAASGLMQKAEEAQDQDEDEDALSP